MLQYLQSKILRICSSWFVNNKILYTDLIKSVDIDVKKEKKMFEYN